MNYLILFEWPPIATSLTYAITSAEIISCLENHLNDIRVQFWERRFEGSEYFAADQGISGPLADEFVIETVIEFAFHQSGSNGLHCLLKILERLVVV